MIRELVSAQYGKRRATTADLSVRGLRVQSTGRRVTQARRQTQTAGATAAGSHALLLEHSGEVVTRDEIQKRLWPEGTYVDFDNAINSAIRKLREALGDSPENPRFVETLAARMAAWQQLLFSRDVTPFPGPDRPAAPKRSQTGTRPKT
jgi:DNA-binding response OmpR family regulator